MGAWDAMGEKDETGGMGGMGGMGLQGWEGKGWEGWDRIGWYSKGGVRGAGWAGKGSQLPTTVKESVCVGPAVRGPAVRGSYRAQLTAQHAATRARTGRQPTWDAEAAWDCGKRHERLIRAITNPQGRELERPLYLWRLHPWHTRLRRCKRWRCRLCWLHAWLCA